MPIYVLGTAMGVRGHGSREDPQLGLTGFTLIDLAAPLQAMSLLPQAEHQVVWKQAGPVVSDAGVTVTATHSLEDAW